VTPNTTTVATGGTLTVSWTAPPGRPSLDWVALVRTNQYNVGPPITISGYAKWAYTGGTTAGSTNFSLSGVAAGTYYCVYLHNNTTTVLATSAVVTVTP
jgi:hypothetical protein